MGDYSRIAAPSSLEPNAAAMSIATDQPKKKAPKQLLRNRKIPTDAAGAPLTERQKEVRAELISAAIRLFHTKGFEATTVSDIADSVGKVRRTFFRYFRSKEDIAFDWMEALGAFMCSIIASRPASESPMQSLRHAFLEMAQRHDDDEQERVKLLTGLILEEPALSSRYHHEYVKWESEFARALKRRQPVVREHSFALEIQIAVVNAAFNLAMRSWIASGAKTLLRPWVETAFLTFKDGDLQPLPPSADMKRRK